ncbi:uncharacterized protein BJ212DRAFT_1544913 [Suillus subaureus]|uniref:Uncharacterized protein n=1 Tax=Suillus subaureus TaxID=48587 RepID=A0A9P7ALD0_9AGAM|nr:uncharacterized protein BJ212DRAFT_1544913 [Suillus subaureus]KAG1791627.1 hypothetical protein BJ212DRAFT_1544913 [Suillus subaureus]
MEALFLQFLWNLRLRLRGCPPLSFVVDALDECTSETEFIEPLHRLFGSLTFL